MHVYLFHVILSVHFPVYIVYSRLYFVSFCPVICIRISLCCYTTNKVNRSQVNLQVVIAIAVAAMNPGTASFQAEGLLPLRDEENLWSGIAELLEMPTGSSAQAKIKKKIKVN